MKQIIYLLTIIFIFFNTIYGIDIHTPPITNTYHNNEHSNREPFINDFLEQPQDGTVVYTSNGNGNGNNKDEKEFEKAFKKWLKSNPGGTREEFTNIYYNIPIGDYWIILLVFVLMYIIYIINNKPKQNK